MVVRIWRGWTTPADADRYETLLEGQISLAIRNRKVRGFRSIEMLRRETSGEVEFMTIMRFDDMEAVRVFAGTNWEEAVVPDEARALLSRFDARSANYAVIGERSAEA